MDWVRSAAFNAWFTGVTLALGLIGIPLRWVVPGGALRLAQLWSGLVLVGARVLCGVRIEVTGREHLPAHGPMLIASQHQSAIDTVIWLRLVPRVSYVFKAELARIPLFGPLLVPAGQIPVQRGGGMAAMRAFIDAGQRAVADDRQIVIFPEGTRVGVGAAVRLRPGVALLAARTGLPIYPVATDSGRLWGRNAFRKRPGVVHVMIGPPIVPDLSPGALMARVQASWTDCHAARRPVDNSVYNMPVT